MKTGIELTKIDKFLDEYEDGFITNCYKDLFIKKIQTNKINCELRFVLGSSAILLTFERGRDVGYQESVAVTTPAVRRLSQSKGTMSALSRKLSTGGQKYILTYFLND